MVHMKPAERETRTNKEQSSDTDKTRQDVKCAYLAIFFCAGGPNLEGAVITGVSTRYLAYS